MMKGERRKSNERGIVKRNRSCNDCISRMYRDRLNYHGRCLSVRVKMVGMVGNGHIKSCNGFRKDHNDSANGL